MAKSKNNSGQLKQEVRILKRENAELQEQKAGMFKLLRSKLKSCQDSQHQLAENCKHYRNRISEALEDANELNIRCHGYEIEQERLVSVLNDLDLENSELRTEMAARTKRANAQLGLLAFVMAVSVVVEGFRFFGG